MSIVDNGSILMYIIPKCFMVTRFRPALGDRLGLPPMSAVVGCEACSTIKRSCLTPADTSRSNRDAGGRIREPASRV